MCSYILDKWRSGRGMREVGIRNSDFWWQRRNNRRWSVSKVFLRQWEKVREGFLVFLFVLKCEALTCELSLSVNINPRFPCYFRWGSPKFLNFPKTQTSQNQAFWNSLTATAFSLPCLPKHKIDLNYFIIIMFITALKQYQPLLLKSLLSFTKINTVKYTSPPSQL